MWKVSIAFNQQIDKDKLSQYIAKFSYFCICIAVLQQRMLTNRKHHQKNDMQEQLVDAFEYGGCRKKKIAQGRTANGLCDGMQKVQRNTTMTLLLSCSPDSPKAFPGIERIVTFRNGRDSKLWFREIKESK